MTVRIRAAWAGCGLLLLCWSGAVLAQDVKTGSAAGAMGQITPGGGVIGIFGEPTSRVQAVFVHPGQLVKAGTLLMTTGGEQSAVDLKLARSQLEAAQRLGRDQNKAQSLAVQLAEGRMRQTQQALEVYQGLGNAVTSRKEADRLRDAAAEARTSLDMERARLRATITQSRSAGETAQRQFDLAAQATQLRAPIDGTILRVARHPGDRVGTDAAIEMADLRRMYVTCQVYEGDLLGMKPGMRATVTGRALPHPLQGQVEDVSRIVNGRARLGEIRVRLDRPDIADRLVGMEVEVNVAR